jgi:hypothetical protein
VEVPIVFVDRRARAGESCITEASATRRRALAGLASLVAAAPLLLMCASDGGPGSGSSGGNGTGGGSGGAECPRKANGCSSDCMGITGARLAVSCVENASVIACSTPGGTLDSGCIKSTETGHVYRLPSFGSSHTAYLAADPAWTACSPDERIAALTVPVCP